MWQLDLSAVDTYCPPSSLLHVARLIREHRHIPCTLARIIRQNDWDFCRCAINYMINKIFCAWGWRMLDNGENENEVTRPDFDRSIMIGF